MAKALSLPECRFKGPVNLSGNKGLTDLSALYISEVINQSDPEKSYISELNLSNTNMQAKAGLFIGEALLAKPKYPIERIKFKDVNLEETGLYRLLEAANVNPSLKSIHLGIISDYGLRIMSELLARNTSLLKLEFQEGKRNGFLYH